MPEAVTKILTSWDNICHFVSKDKLHDFEIELKSLQTFLALSYDLRIDRHDYLVYYCDKDYSPIDKVIEQDELVKKQVQNLKQKLENILDDFEYNKGIKVIVEPNYEALYYGYYSEGVLFVLEWNDVLELTTKAKKLKEDGCMFEVKSWSVTV